MRRILSDIDVFLAVAQSGSFSTGAHNMGLTPSAVSKRIQLLEQSLKATLFNRTTRRLTLTDEGQMVFDHALIIAREADAIEDALAQANATPRGLLKLALPTSVGYSMLNEAIAEFALAYPEISLQTFHDDGITDLVGGGFDAAIRIGSLADSTLRAKKLLDCPMTLCAAPDYLERMGRPEKPEDLKNHVFLTYQNAARPALWTYQTPTGQEGSITLPSRFSSNNGDMLLKACLQGLGIVMLPAFFTHNAVMAGTLVHIMPDYKPLPERAVYVVTPPQISPLPKVRAFIDFMSQWFSKANHHGA